jgi:succinyl-diaminopimelate desuccinylase
MPDDAVTDPVALAAELVACPSVTPADAGALPLLAERLGALGFETELVTFGTAPDGPVLNLFATRGEGRHFAFAGHTDVVPAGDGWAGDAFVPVIADGVLVGRGAADMKGALAAMVAAAERHVARGAPGRLSFVVTGDEEGPAVFGTDALLGWMAERGFVPDACLVASRRAPGGWATRSSTGGGEA